MNTGDKITYELDPDQVWPDFTHYLRVKKNSNGKIALADEDDDAIGHLESGISTEYNFACVYHVLAGATHFAKSDEPHSDRNGAFPFNADSGCRVYGWADKRTDEAELNQVWGDVIYLDNSAFGVLRSLS